MNQINQNPEPSYNWSIKIDDALRKPVTLFAVQSGKQIRVIITQAVNDYLQNLKAGE